MRAGFDDLTNQFAQKQLLGEVLGTDHDQIRVSFATGNREKKYTNEKRAKHLQPRSSHFARSEPSRRSSCPRTKSDMSASKAAGTAPAKITRLSSMESPRNMNSPSPPAPIAAAMVASPMETTVAMRTPATITPEANGNSTCQSNWPSVSPMARPASTTEGSTPRMPVYVF